MIKSLVAPEGSLINRRIFADNEIYELERERLFARCWLYLGHESEVPRPEISLLPIWEKSPSFCGVT